MKKTLPILLLSVAFVITIIYIISSGEKIKKEAQSLNATKQEDNKTKLENSQNNNNIGELKTENLETYNEITLNITSPVDGSVSTDSNIVIKGTTKTKAEVFVNDTENIADKDGNFSFSLTLDEGENYISILAVDENGAFSEKELIVYYESLDYK